MDVNINTNDDSVNNSTKPFLQNSDGVLLVYSVTDKNSLKVIESMLRILQQVKSSRGTPVVLVGNKVDLRGLREVRTSDGREFAFNIGSSFYEISTRYGRYDVNSVFYDVIRQIRCVRYRARVQEKACANVSGLIRRLSLKSRRRHFKRQSSAT